MSHHRVKNWENACYDYARESVKRYSFDKSRPHMAIIDEWTPVPIPKFGWEVVCTKLGTVEVRRDADSKKPLAVFTEKDLPDWLNERLSVLTMIKVGHAVEGVGQRIWENVYWVEGVKE